VREYALPRRDTEEPRGVGQVGVNVNGRPLTVLNTHLSEVPEARAAQVRWILRTIAGIRGPLILMGDFNARPTAPEIRLLTRRLRDAAAVRRLRTPTVANTRLDYVFVSRGITVLDARIPSPSAYRVSDHRPLIVRLRLDRTCPRTRTATSMSCARRTTAGAWASPWP
jgi:endonuclease/exonuclease/phosphatase family metal-dependent hydrolase